MFGGGRRLSGQDKPGDWGCGLPAAGPEQSRAELQTRPGRDLMGGAYRRGGASAAAARAGPGGASRCRRSKGRCSEAGSAGGRARSGGRGRCRDVTRAQGQQERRRCGAARVGKCQAARARGGRRKDPRNFSRRGLVKIGRGSEAHAFSVLPPRCTSAWKAVGVRVRGATVRWERSRRRLTESKGLGTFI